MTYEAFEAVAVQPYSDNRADNRFAQEVYGDSRQDFLVEKQKKDKSNSSDSDLPGIQLFDSEGRHDGIISGAMRIGADLLQGAANEAVHHPDRLLGNIAISAAVGALAVISTPAVLIGGAAIGVAAIGIGVLNGHNPVEAVGDFISDCGVVANPDGHSAYEVARAHETVQAGGGVMLEVGVGALAGSAGAAAMSAMRSGSVAAIETSVMPSAIESAETRLLANGTRGGVIDAEFTVVDDLAARASSAIDDTVAQAPRTYDGNVGTSASAGFDAARRLEGQALLARLQEEAVAAGYPYSYEQFAIRNLRDGQDIRTFVGALEERHTPRQIFEYLNHKVFAGNRVMHGTEGAWEAELARLRTVLTESGVDPSDLGPVQRLARADFDGPRTSAWMDGRGGRFMPQTGDDLLSALRSEAQTAGHGANWRTYAITRLRDHTEIQDFVQALAKTPEWVGRERELASALRFELESPLGNSWAEGTVRAWDLALRHLRDGSRAA